MAKIYFNSRDELTGINPDMIAAVQANGNYSRVVYINKHEIDLTIGISKMEEVLKQNSSRRNKFIRLGRSIIINHAYLHKIDLQRQLLILSDDGVHEIRVNLSKKIIKPYKQAVIDSTKIKKRNAENNIRNKREPAV